MNSLSVAFFVLFLSVVELFRGTDNAALQSVGVKNSLYEIPGLGNRPLFIKAFPAVENFQSDLYEVYAEPYTYDLRPQSAVAVIRGEGEVDVKGELLFLQKHPPTGPTLIRGNITGLSAGKHGFHVFQSGDLREGCEKLGGHFNPYLMQHGGPRDALRHAGDLGNIEADDSGTAEVNIIDPIISLSGGPRSIVGRAIVVTSDPDDYGNGDSAASLISGNSGNPVGCGVIAYIT